MGCIDSRQIGSFHPLQEEPYSGKGSGAEHAKLPSELFLRHAAKAKSQRPNQ
jgi:hypothetical protein